MTQERQDGWYFVWLDGGSKWYPGWWRNYDQQWISGVGIYEVPFLAKKIGPRIPSPDEPNALLDIAQKAQALADVMNDGTNLAPWWDARAALREALAKLKAGS